MTRTALAGRDNNLPQRGFLHEERVFIPYATPASRIPGSGVPAVVFIAAVIPVELAPVPLVAFPEVIFVMIQVIPELVDGPVGEEMLETPVEEHLAVHRLDLKSVAEFDEVPVKQRAQRAG